MGEVILCHSKRGYTEKGHTSRGHTEKGYTGRGHIRKCQTEKRLYWESSL